MVHSMLIWVGKLINNLISINYKYNFICHLLRDIYKSILQSWNYLGKVIEDVKSLMERFLELLDVETSSVAILPTENAGCLGFGMATVSLASITTTSDMVGLSLASSWTHNKPICMHLSTSLPMKDFSSIVSIDSKHFPSYHILQAYTSICSLLILLTLSYLIIVE